MKINNLLWVCAILLVGCAENVDNTSTTKVGNESLEQQELSWKVTHSFVTDTNEHYRGLDIKNGIAYVAGSKGGIYTIDLSTQEIKQLFLAEGRHLRDIDVLENGSIVALAITEPAEILLKESNSEEFQVVYTGEDSLFLDGISFLNSDFGMAFGDPIKGMPTTVMTPTGGYSWVRNTDATSFPSTSEKYAGFAASGTSIVFLAENTILIGLGSETAKILRSTTLGFEWELIDVPYHSEPGGSGIYSMAFKDSLNGVAVGGHWQNVTCDSSKIYTTDGGLTWQLSKGVQEYRSCVTYFNNDIYISTGTTGTDISYDGGKNWQLLDTIGYNAIAFREDGTGIAVGSYGQIDLLELTNQ